MSKQCNFIGGHRAMLLCVVLGGLLPQSLLAKAALQEIGVNKLIDFNELLKTREINIVTRRDKDRIFVDASVVLDNNVDKIVAAITDYNRYVSWGMPALKYNRVLNQNANQYLTWNWVRRYRIDSKHCLRATKTILKENHSAYVAWHLVVCPTQHDALPKEMAAEYADVPAFKQVDGYIYLENIQSLGGQKRVYLRYSLAATVQSFLPSSVVYLVSQINLKSDIINVIRILDKAYK